MSSEDLELESVASAARAQRLHPTTLAFSFLGHVKGLIFPILLVLFVASDDNRELWLALFIIPAMVFEVYRYATYRYRFESGELIVTQGVLFKNERHVPFARIQNVDSTQSFLQRLFGVAEARVETAGGSEPEAVLRVLSVAQLDQMRVRVFQGREETAGSEPDVQDPGLAFEERRSAAGATDARVLYRATPGDLLLLGLNPGRGLAVVFVFLGLLWELDAFEDLALSDSYETLFSIASVGAVILGAMLLAVVSATLVLLLSIGVTFLRLYDFRLERSGDEFRVRCGLLTRVSTTIPRRRIQFVSVQSPPLLRWFGRVSVKVETAGGHQEEGQVAATKTWFLPVLHRRDLKALLSEIDPRLELAGVEWRPLAPKARRRFLKREAISSVVVTALALAVWRPWGALALPITLPWFLWLGNRAARLTKYARTPYGVLFQSGAVYRKLGITFFGRIQVVTLAENPFDRRYRMASVRVDTAGAGAVGHKIAIPFLEREIARDLREDLAATAELAPLAW